MPRAAVRAQQPVPLACGVRRGSVRFPQGCGGVPAAVELSQLCYSPDTNLIPLVKWEIWPGTLSQQPTTNVIVIT